MQHNRQAIQQSNLLSYFKYHFYCMWDPPNLPHLFLHLLPAPFRHAARAAVAVRTAERTTVAGVLMNAGARTAAGAWTTAGVRTTTFVARTMDTEKKTTDTMMTTCARRQAAEARWRPQRAHADAPGQQGREAEAWPCGGRAGRRPALLLPPLLDRRAEVERRWRGNVVLARAGTATART